MTFADRVAVVTGGGTGIGRALSVLLAAEGCSVAVCDLNPSTAAATAALANDGATGGARVTAHGCDVAAEAEVLRFRDEMTAQHGTHTLDLLFNNAGIHSRGSFVTGSRQEWDRTFTVCWNGVYNCSRAFMPLLVASASAWLVNVSSVNGLLAVGSAYSAAKFAVRGFTEALIDDFRVNAPHVKVALVMPGYVGTDIVHNSRVILGGGAAAMTDKQRVAFRKHAPTSPPEAAHAILDGLRAGRWRILVGDDAQRLDAATRADPVAAYAPGAPTS